MWRCWAGLRSAIVGCVFLVAYAWVIYNYPISAFGKDHSKANQAILWTAIVYPMFAVIAGVVQAKLRAAATREYEARVVADSESEQRRIAEAELWASEEMRRLIVDSSVDAIVGIEGDGTITTWNPHAERLFGWTQAEAIGSCASERIVPAGVAGSPGILDFGKGSVLRERTEVTVQPKAGEVMSVELYIADHRTESGVVYIAFFRDISDRKRAEKAIQELNASLEERVAERTAQLEKANSELIGFTYSVSHDLRAPLRGIIGNSRIVREEASKSLDSDAAERLRRLESSALKMAELIENLLQFARMGQLALNPRELDLSALAEGIAKDLKTKKEGTISIQPGMVVRGDADMVMMVLLNLMENAWKYVRPEQTPQVEVGATPEGAIYVRDRGIGFDMKYVDKIWAPFERLHREDEYPGTGIGLANSKRIVDRHGGKIWAESSPGEGTTMYFELASNGHAAESKRRTSYVS